MAVINFFKNYLQVGFNIVLVSFHTGYSESNVHKISNSAYPIVALCILLISSFKNKQ